MKKYIPCILIIPSICLALTARDIIKRVDQNENFTTQKFSVVMIIKKGKRELVKRFNGYGQKKGEKAFMTFTNTEDRGVKYLKIGNELWIYFPDADDIMKISGHMLRQGMMGSDISYEDMLENNDFEKNYSSRLLSDQVVQGKKCYVIQCDAKIKKTAYARQILYIDKKLYSPLKIEMFAKGGRLIKKMSMHNIKKIAGRNVPMKLIIQDMRKRNSKTIITFESVKFNIHLPAGIFTRRNLRR